jgi:hypothetical protein
MIQVEVCRDFHNPCRLHNSFSSDIQELFQPSLFPERFSASPSNRQQNIATSQSLFLHRTQARKGKLEDYSFVLYLKWGAIASGQTASNNVVIKAKWWIKEQTSCRHTSNTSRLTQSKMPSWGLATNKRSR